jgi:mannose-6-phosphate isomerase-like protein (cupin superfamily)
MVRKLPGMPVEILRIDGQGHRHTVLGMHHEYKARPSEGSPNLVFLLDVPHGCGAPPHHHERDGEAFYILEGEICFTTADSRMTARAGDFVYAGPGHVHSFENRSGRPARALVVQTPGVEAEAFFEAMAAANARPGFDATREVAQIAGRFGIAIHPPVIAAAA